MNTTPSVSVSCKQTLEPVVILLDPPRPFCAHPVHMKDLTEATLEKKQCVAKKCRHLIYVKKIVRWP
jgi:hypothetical protein